MSVSLDVMHSKPGIYLIVTYGGCGFVETDAEGRCYQLRHDTFERDGELPQGEWHPQRIMQICGPLARVA